MQAAACLFELGGMATRCCVAMGAGQAENLATQRRVTMPPGRIIES